jgi:hypothetical protein
MQTFLLGKLLTTHLFGRNLALLAGFLGGVGPKIAS